MEWIRHHPKTAGGVAAVVSVLLIVLLWLMVKPDNSTAESAPDPSLPTRTPLTALPSPSASATGGTTLGGADFPGGISGLSDLGGSGGGAATGGTFGAPGLQGGSMYQFMTKHSITLRVTSSAPIGTIGYVMPTSLNESSGRVDKVGTSWSLSSTVYGDPDYARIFVQSGARGFPITCTITVDGKVTERRSTEGPYGQMVCQG